MKKKILYLTAVFVMAVSLCACGSEAANDVTNTPAAIPSNSPMPNYGTANDGIVDDDDGILDDDLTDNDILDRNDDNKTGTGTTNKKDGAAESTQKPATSASPSPSAQAK